MEAIRFYESLVIIYQSIRHKHHHRRLKFQPTITGHAVAQLFEAPRYKPEGRGFDSRWCHWNFSLT
jgi:hypothetical protein